jgi:hypothetical protein
MNKSVHEYQGNRGFISTASGKDYLEMGYLQALSIKTTQKNENNYAIIVDKNTADLIENKHQDLFDQIIVLDETWNFSQEWRVKHLTPWRRNIKLDVDMIFVNDIESWWNSFENWRLLFTTTVEDYKSQEITSRWHRHLFDSNRLPNIYTAFYYFKDGPESAEFFELCKKISDEWTWFANEFLIKNDNPNPRDDEIFAIAAEIYGTERCTLPGAAYPRFVHFKEPLNSLPEGKPWHEQLHVEYNNQMWIGIILSVYLFTILVKHLQTKN